MKSLNILLAVLMIGASSAGFAAGVHEEYTTKVLPCGKTVKVRMTANSNPVDNAKNYDSKDYKTRQGVKN